MSDPIHPAEASILYADDTEAQRYAVSRILRKAGFNVLEASTGREALEMTALRPDLIILDVNLPDISGLEVCRQIKSSEAMGRTPVLQVSATSVNTKARVAGLEGGADAYLVQPIDPEELIATVRAHLRVRKAEEALLESRQQYRSFFEATPLACWVFDNDDLRILAVNAAAVTQYGHSRDEFLQLTLPDIVTHDDWPSVADLLDRAVLTTPNGRTWKHKTSSGGIIEVEMVWAPLRLNDRDAHLVIVQDVTERLRRQAEEQQEELQRLLLQRVLRAQEEERGRIARELHDETGQLMTSLLVGLRSLSDARRLTDAKAQAKRLREIASEAIGELGRLARGLHSSVLDDLGLEPAIQRYADDFSSTHRIQVTFSVPQGRLAQLSKEEQLNLYRIIQEALTNVARHSRADRVNITFEYSGSNLVIHVRDNGRGIAPQQPDNHSQHLGIEGMRQRAAMLGGTLEVLSEATGVTVLLRVPARSAVIKAMDEVKAIDVQDN